MAGLGEGTGCLSSHSPKPLPNLPLNQPSMQLSHAQELCLPPHDVPQSNETFTNPGVMLCPRKLPQNATERDSMGSTSCCRENCLRAELWWL